MPALSGRNAATDIESIANDGFWLDLEMQELIEDYRIPSEYAGGVIKMELINAMLKVNTDLKQIKDKVLLIPFTKLSDYNQANIAKINGEHIRELRYKCAVFSYAKYLLLKQFKTINRRTEAENEAKESPQVQNEWLQKSDACIGEFFDEFFADNDKINTPAGFTCELI